MDVVINCLIFAALISIIYLYLAASACRTDFSHISHCKPGIFV